MQCEASVINMLIKYQALNTIIHKKSFALYILIGTEPYLLNDAAIQIKQALLKQNEFETKLLEINSTAEWADLIQEANSYSLFYEHVLIDARYDKKTIEAKGKELITQYLNDINQRSCIMLRSPMISSKSINWLHQNSNVLIIQVNPLTDALQQQWIETRCKALNIQISRELVHSIHHFTEGNLLATAQLIEKLSIAYPTGIKLTELILNEYLSDERHYDVYQLADACLNGDAKKTLNLLQQAKAQQTEATLVLWILTQEIRRLIQLKKCTEHSESSIEKACEKLSIWSSRIPIYRKATNRFSLAKLYALLTQCNLVDETIKTSKSFMYWNHLDNIAINMCKN